MFKNFGRILIGLALLWSAWTLNNHATAEVKDTISPPAPAVMSDLPTDPADVVEVPENKKRINDAVAVGRVASRPVRNGGARCASASSMMSPGRLLTTSSNCSPRCYKMKSKPMPSPRCTHG
jgi:hypothetical protein